MESEVGRMMFGLTRLGPATSQYCAGSVTGRCYEQWMGLVSTRRAAWLGQWVFPNEPELRAWLSRKTLSGFEIDDVVQETYAVLAGMESVDHIRNPRTYMFEVAKSVVLQALRRSRIVTFDTLAEVADGMQLPADEPSPEQIVADRQELGRVAALIAALPPKCREAFTLRKVHGLSQKQAARRLGVSENTIEKHVGKALAILTQKIGHGGMQPSESSNQRDRANLSTSQRSVRNRRGH